MTDAANSRARYRRILRFAARYMAQSWWFELFLPRIGLSRLAARGREARMLHGARKFRALAVDLGGLMIKVGQFMSSRLDVLPPAITDELAGLQDEVPPVAFDAIRERAEAELGVPLTRAYARFDEVPVAAASLGQAHRAQLVAADAQDTGFADVVVKIQRPGIQEIVEVDVAALRKVARWLSRMKVVREHVDLPALVEEFAHTSREEIDYLHEAQNAERFAESFLGDARVAVPAVAWERSTRRVLTLADVTAIKINDVPALREAGIDPDDVAMEFARVMFDQLFTHGYFHADPHPGNIFVTPLPHAAPGERSWRFTFIDFGMMGEVPDDLRQGLQQALIAVASRNSRRLVESIQNLGMVLPSADTAEIERAMAALFARFGGMGFADLQKVDPRELQDFASEFSDLVRTMPFQLPENFLLIIRAVSLTSGMCSALNPDFNVWDAVEPYALKLLRDERGNVVQAFSREAAAVGGIIVGLPRRVDDLVTKLDDGRLAVDMSSLDRRFRSLERLGRRAVSGMIFASLLIGGVLLLPANEFWGTALMITSIPALLHAVFSGLIGGPR